MSVDPSYVMKGGKILSKSLFDILKCRRFFSFIFHLIRHRQNGYVVGFAIKSGGFHTPNCPQWFQFDNIVTPSCKGTRFPLLATLPKAVANFYDRKSKENANKIKTVAAFSPKNRQENKKIYSCRMMSLSRKKTHVGILDLLS